MIVSDQIKVTWPIMSSVKWGRCERWVRRRTVALGAWRLKLPWAHLASLCWTTVALKCFGGEFTGRSECFRSVLAFTFGGLASSFGSSNRPLRTAHPSPLDSGFRHLAGVFHTMAMSRGFPVRRGGPELVKKQTGHSEKLEIVCRGDFAFNGTSP